MARIVINTDRTLGEIHPHIYGQFIEHLGRCIYGGIYDPGSRLADENGFRRDVMEALRELKPGILRWPGGNFSSGYHWQDGVGPRRNARPELAWNTIEPNTFGTDEFIRYCRAVNCEPYICLNMGNGTMDEAISWVEYCNVEQGTQYSEMRRANGAEAPHAVKYWGLGNELWGDFQIGHKTAEEYAWQARDWAKVIKRMDSDIRLVACGGTGNAPAMRWDLEVLERTAEFIDYTALHYYWGPHEGDPYLTTLAGAYEFERYLKYVEGCIDAVRRDRNMRKPIWVSIDEWNVNYHTGSHTMRYTLRDALADAVFIHMMQRHCGTVKMANLAQAVNVIPAIEAGPDGMFLQSIYWPLWVASNVAGPLLIDCWTEVEGFTWDRLPGQTIPYLDAVATLDPATNRAILSVVNLHPTAEIGTGIALIGPQMGNGVIVRTLTADSPDAHNEFTAPNEVALVSERRESGNPLGFTFPPKSLTVIEFAVG